MIPKKVKEHLEEYINQEVYVQIAIIKGKEKVSTHLAINKYFNSNHFKDLSNGKPYDHFIDGLKDKCLGKLKNSPMRNKKTNDATIQELQNKLNNLSDEDSNELFLPKLASPSFSGFKNVMCICECPDFLSLPRMSR